MEVLHIGSVHAVDREGAAFTPLLLEVASIPIGAW